MNKLISICQLLADAWNWSDYWDTREEALAALNERSRQILGA